MASGLVCCIWIHDIPPTCSVVAQSVLCNGFIHLRMRVLVRFLCLDILFYLTLKNSQFQPWLWNVFANVLSSFRYVALWNIWNQFEHLQTCHVNNVAWNFWCFNLRRIVCCVTKSKTTIPGLAFIAFTWERANVMARLCLLIECVSTFYVFFLSFIFNLLVLLDHFHDRF